MKIEIPLEELRKRKLMLATPMYGGMSAGLYTKSVADLAAQCANHGVSLQFHFLFNESLITRARNYCCDEFMRSEADYLLFIDADIGFNPQDVLFMLAMMGPETPYDVMCAPYPKKCISWEKIKRAVEKGHGAENPVELERFAGDFVFNPAPGVTQMPLGQPSEVLESGTGFMLIRKSALKKFYEAYSWNRMYRPDHVRSANFDGSREIMMYFQAAVDRFDPEKDYEAALKKIVETESLETAETIAKEVLAKVADEQKKHSKRYLSEDYLFCQDARKIGLKIWLCPWMQTLHVGSYIFGGSLGAMAELGVSPTADISMLRPKKGAAA